MRKASKREKKAIYRYNEDDERTLLEDILGFVKVFAITAIVILVFMNFIAHPIKVNGRSMDPTLQDGEFGFTNLVSVWTGQIHRYDIVVVTTDQEVTNEETKETTTEEIQIVKRVIGMPGDTISCIDDEIYINGAQIDESDYIDPSYIEECRDQYGYFNAVEQVTKDDDGKTIVDYVDFEEVTLGDDEYFVMGDNRPVSKDSRDPSIGVIKKSQIYGVGVLVLLPFEQIGIKG